MSTSNYLVITLVLVNNRYSSYPFDAHQEAKRAAKSAVHGTDAKGYVGNYAVTACCGPGLRPRPGLLRRSAGQRGRVLPTTSCACVVTYIALPMYIGDQSAERRVCRLTADRQHSSRRSGRTAHIWLPSASLREVMSELLQPVHNPADLTVAKQGWFRTMGLSFLSLMDDASRKKLHVTLQVVPRVHH